MTKVLLYYAHPGHQVSRANKKLFEVASQVAGVTCVDLYAEYPRFDIDVDAEHARLLDHEIVVFQCPLFWYSTPAIIKEWQDLVLEQGFAYGHDGTALTGKVMLMALTAAGPEEAYSEQGYQHFDLRTFLSPLEQTAGLCKMRFAAPYVLFDALRETDVPGERIAQHAQGYQMLLNALVAERYDFDAADKLPVIHGDELVNLVSAQDE